MEVANQVKFDSPNKDAIVWKYPSESLKLGSQVIVNQSQEAVFVKNGVALDVFGAGTHTLSTGNLPILGRLIKSTFGGKTPFTAEVWFVNKTAHRGLKWGTKGPIQIIDPVYNFPISVRAFGQWGLRITDAQSFVSQIVGSQMSADTDVIEDYFSGEIVQKVASSIANFISDVKLSIFQINTKLNELSEAVQAAIIPEFDRFGIEIVNFNIERISIPDEETKKFQDVLGKKMEASQLSTADVSQNYITIKSMDALSKAAESSGNPMGAMVGVGLGVGMAGALGRQMANSINDTQDAPMQRLQKLKSMLDAGLITQDDFDSKKQQILSEI